MGENSAEVDRVSFRVEKLSAFISNTKNKLRITFVLKKASIFILKIFLYTHAASAGLILIICMLYNFVNPPFTSLMIYRKLVDNHTVKPVWYVPYQQIPYKLKRMVIKVEDYKFFQHRGIDIPALIEAYKKNNKVGYTKYGGSTITMQLARTLFLVPHKSYLRKYAEIIIALEMDLIMKKERILELYLNYVEWGEGIFGVGEACSYYYGKNPRTLSTDQMRRLATILPNPLEYGVNDFWKNQAMLKRYSSLVSIH